MSFERFLKFGILLIPLLYLIGLFYLFITPNYLWLDEAKYALLGIQWAWFRNAWYTFPTGLATLYSIWLSIINTHYSVKFISFVASLLSIFTLYKLSITLFIKHNKSNHKYTEPQTVELLKSMALLLSLSLLYPFWRYAIELNQYSIDIAIQFLLLYNGFLLVRDKTTIGRLTIISAIVLWFSRPAIYTILSILLVYTIKQFSPILLRFCTNKKVNVHKIIKIAKPIILSILIILTSWFSLYFLRAKYVINHKGLKHYWHKSMGAKYFCLHFKEALKEPFVHTLHFNTAQSWKILAILILVGLLYLIFTNNFLYALMLTLPSILTALSTILNKFPWSGRLLSFLTVHYIILAAFGTIGIAELIKYAFKRLFQPRKININIAIISYLATFLGLFFLFIPYLSHNILQNIRQNTWGSGGLGEIMEKTKLASEHNQKWILMWGNIEYSYYAHCYKSPCRNSIFMPGRNHLIDPNNIALQITQSLKNKKDSTFWIISAHLNSRRYQRFEELCTILGQNKKLTIIATYKIRDAIACKLKYNP